MAQGHVYEDADSTVAGSNPVYDSAFHRELHEQDDLVVAGQAPARIEIPSITDASRALSSAIQNREPLDVRARLITRVGIAGLDHAESQNGNGAAAVQQRRLGLDLATHCFNEDIRIYRNAGLPVDSAISIGALGIAQLQQAGLTELTPANVLAAQRGPQANLVNRALDNLYDARTDIQTEVTRLAALATRTATQQRDLDQYRAILTALPTVTRAGEPGARTFTLTAGGNRANLIQALMRRSGNS